MATNAAQATTTDGEGQLARLKDQLELRAHTLSKREIELDELLRARERTVKELEEHLRAAISMLSKRDATVAALEKRWRWSSRRPRNTGRGSRRWFNGRSRGSADFPRLASQNQKRHLGCLRVPRARDPRGSDQ